MQRLSLTPFGRQPVTAGLIDRTRAAMAPAPVATIDKWSILRELTTARAAFGLTDRDLTVLSALLSFHRTRELTDDGPIIVFPSNATLAQRAHGMAESTLRRHIATLVRAGLIARHDSPNGKRYARGTTGLAFGFDLRPLLVASERIVHAAAEAHRAAEALSNARGVLTLLLRDAAKLVEFGQNNIDANWIPLSDELRVLRRTRRRNLTLPEVQDLISQTETLLRQIKSLLNLTAPSQTPKAIACDGRNERHNQSQTNTLIDSEIISEPEKSVEPLPSKITNDTIPLNMVIEACPDIIPYAEGNLTTPEHLVRSADFLRGMIGISPETWFATKDTMGPYKAAVTLAAMLQRIRVIRNPGGYLRTLTQKAREVGFSPLPMVTALLQSVDTGT